MINKRGLSAVVTTLIIILLVIVAVGIIWVVVRNVIDQGSEQIELSARCLEVDIQTTAVVSTGTTFYDITLHRNAGGDDVGGIKIVFFNSTGDTSTVIGSPGNIAPLGTVVRNIDGEITGVNKVEVTPYFLDASSTELLCSQTHTWP